MQESSTLIEGHIRHDLWYKFHSTENPFISIAANLFKSGYGGHLLSLLLNNHVSLVLVLTNTNLGEGIVNPEPSRSPIVKGARYGMQD